MANKRREGDTPRKSFLVHPHPEMAAKIETLCKQCDLSANTLLRRCIEYAFDHMELRPKQVYELHFEDENDEL